MKFNKICLVCYSLFFFFVGINSLAFAANLYVDEGSIEPDATWNGNNGQTYTCPHGNGKGFSSIQAAIIDMNGGDDIFVRQGTYYETEIGIPQTKNGSSSNWSSIQSYPGEWAIIDASGGQWGIGRWGFSKTGGDDIGYWIIQRLEIKNAGDSDGAAGIWISGGPNKIRYCYIHDNIETADGGICGGNPAGVTGMIWDNSVIEYCYFENNGCTATDEMHASHINIHSDYLYTSFNIDHATRKNEFRYNLFVDSDDRALHAFHHKAQQFLIRDHANVDWAYKEYGDKFHHNIIFDGNIRNEQDYAQYYNNIVVSDLPFEISPNYQTGMSAVCVYNNTLIGSGSPSGPYFSVDWTVTQPYSYLYNNILDKGGERWDAKEVSVGSSPDGGSWDWSKVDIDNNYLYQPVDQDVDSYLMGRKLSGDNLGVALSTFDFNALDNMEDNQQKNLSDDSDRLMTGESGASKYITKADHIVEGSTTIANGGKGGDHPYLAGVRIPSYLGATNPNDNSWVAGVLGLANVATLESSGVEDPDWVEGQQSQSQPDDLAPPTNLKISPN